jgi:hypothetical protein|eukprot:GHVU01195228.1.p3 GENE.GHVU01195228.1~~GHVU01195228.1.p3  ORF type:complete len:103 (+),score=10.63 GHVU01195228.1:699-1007(+)
MHCTAASAGPEYMTACPVPPPAAGLQPPGYVHKLLADTFQPLGLAITPTGGGPGRMTNIDNASVSASAQASADGKTVVVRLANLGTQLIAVAPQAPIRFCFT